MSVRHYHLSLFNVNKQIIKPQLFYLVDTWIDMDLEEKLTDNFIKRSKNC